MFSFELVPCLKCSYFGVTRSIEIGGQQWCVLIIFRKRDAITVGGHEHASRQETAGRKSVQRIHVRVLTTLGAGRSAST